MHMEPPPTPLVKSKHNDKSDKDFVKLKLCRDPKSEKLDLYKFKMDLLENGKPEEFLLLIRNFNMTLKASRRTKTSAKDNTLVLF